jgi:hypothetical protein
MIEQFKPILRDVEGLQNQKSGCGRIRRSSDYNALSRFLQAVLILKFFRIKLIFRTSVNEFNCSAQVYWQYPDQCIVVDSSRRV